jgi:predicted RNA-binding Zn ribbon-like protein
VIRPDLCIDFANTRFWRGSPEPTERLATAEDLEAWCRAEGIGAPAELDAAIAFREAIYRIFAAASAGAEPVPEDLALLNQTLAAAPARQRLVRMDGHYVWDVGSLGETPLAPVAWSAADLLVGPLLGRVRLCANERCRWLFLDESKSGNRRWCSMSACGNRAKAHRHYARQKERQSES